MAKLTDIDKLLEQLESSVMLKKLIQTIKCHWVGDAEQISNSSQKVDQQFQGIIAQKEIVEKVIEVPVEKIIYKDKIIEIPIEKIVEKKIEVTPTWALSLEEQKGHLDSLVQFPELQSIFNIEQYDDTTKILAFISASSQWQNILRIWDKLAIECKSSQQELEAGKLKLLENAVFLYNLTLSNSQAQLKTPDLNTDYDYNIHNQISGVGDQIKLVLLPGVYSASGEKVKSALVITA
ncbi:MULTISPECIES: hypothetical protein [Acinetobacter]|nr:MULTISPECIES: hypothetical protein [Acinetobacter]NUF61706.1 hypothetical protein [Acinetobacter bereziniae]NUG09668.1 hypothetical protein [Acinetobacter bereziniae]NUG63992.1 hypothetical protein [Acinetobacter bereziniae]NUG70204.1 hypothetical protein [Acinetobacter bereziniae]RZG67869.1 hypothetical protein EXE26_08320 [Acinetobacter junii]